MRRARAAVAISPRAMTSRVWELYFIRLPLPGVPAAAAHAVTGMPSAGGEPGRRGPLRRYEAAAQRAWPLACGTRIGSRSNQYRRDLTSRKISSYRQFRRSREYGESGNGAANYRADKGEQHHDSPPFRGRADAHTSVEGPAG